MTKSRPRKTPVTPFTPNSRCASGDIFASSAFGKSAVPSSKTVCPGKNFSVAGFGVDSVCMNIAWPLLQVEYVNSDQKSQEFRTILNCLSLMMMVIICQLIKLLLQVALLISCLVRLLLVSEMFPNFWIIEKPEGRDHYCQFRHLKREYQYRDYP